MLRRIVFVLVVLAIAAAAGALAWRQYAPPQVALVAPTRGPAVEAIYATGMVEPTLEIRVAPRSPGRIVELKADEGDAVKKGQLLARLEDADLRASVTELEARLQYAQGQFDRSVQLQRAALISKDALEKSRSDLDAARATLKRAREQLAFMRIEAPASGRIIRRDGEVGEYVPANQVIFYMAGPAPLRITADVDEEDVPRVKPGLPVLIRAEAFPDRVFDGRVDQVTPRGDPQSRSYRVRIALVGDPPLQIGMTAETNIVLDRREQALLLPSGAIEGGKVWRVDRGHAHAQAVTVGVVGPERTEIRAGLAPDDRVIAQPPAGLKEGARVRLAP